MMTVRRLMACGGLLLLLWLMGGRGLQAQASLEADSAPYLVAVTAGFVGTDFLVFGAREGSGDVIVVVRGPIVDYSVRRKHRLFGIWVNTDRVSFGDVPSFYAVASSRPLDDVLPPQSRAQQGIGLDQLQLPTVKPERETDIDAFRAALIRLKQSAGLFTREVGTVEFRGARLFRGTIHLPSNVPTGKYFAEVLLVQDGEIVAQQQVHLEVDKSGVGAHVFQFAHQYSPAYGLSAIAGALLLGWMAHLVFRQL
jgi:uncharacterized protein (TIGR02186 family)